MQRSAEFSSCRMYRYRLTRRWGNGNRVTFIMLNPSTADAEKDDPTIRRCIGFALRDGFGGLEVVNLFAGRATRPADLFAMEDPKGPENQRYLDQLNQSDDVVVAAWGAHRQATSAFVELNRSIRFPEMLCLGISKAGAPRHPLYVRKDAKLVPWDESNAKHQRNGFTEKRYFLGTQKRDRKKL